MEAAVCGASARRGARSAGCLRQHRRTLARTLTLTHPNPNPNPYLTRCQRHRGGGGPRGARGPLPRRSRVKLPPWAAPQLGARASSARAWRLRAARRSQEEAGPLGAQPPPRGLEPAASKAT
eukprot:scaffold61983_cov72-Phaeocystis_antarctica.AAC.2